MAEWFKSKGVWIVGALAFFGVAWLLMKQREAAIAGAQDASGGASSYSAAPTYADASGVGAALQVAQVQQAQQQAALEAGMQLLQDQSTAAQQNNLSDEAARQRSAQVDLGATLGTSVATDWTPLRSVSTSLPPVTRER